MEEIRERIRIVGEMPKYPEQKIVAAFVEYHGKPRIDFRVYYQSEPDKWMPTKKGFYLDPESWDDFKELVGEMDRAIKAN